ncbi:MAG: transcription factor S [Candidatus Woesearchaeota archaeon]
MFCPKCGSLLLPKTVDGKKSFVCSCGYTNQKINNTEQQIKENLRKKTEEMPVIEQEVEPLPVISAYCQKCGHDQAYFWTVQTRASDEPETKFFKCKKCSNVWRDYS